MSVTDKTEIYEKTWKKLKDEFPNNSKILVTGANGLIASNLIELLMYFNETHHTQNLIIALCRSLERGRARFQNFLKEDYFELIGQDVCSLKLNERCDYIIHAASNAHPLAYAKEPIATMKTNVIGTINILDYALESNSKKIVYISTSEIYGDDLQNEKYIEGNFGSVNTLNPRSCYSESKRCSETLCVSYVKEKKMDISIVRPGYIYGAQITKENSRADAQFLRNVINGQNIVMKSEGLQRRSYCYVDDAVCAILFVMLRGNAGDAYNIANESSDVTIREYAEMMARIGGVEVNFEQPSDIEKSGYSVIKNSVLNGQKLMDLGWEPFYDLKSGLTRMLYNCKIKK